MSFKLKTKSKTQTEPEATDTIEVPAQTKTETPEQTVDAIGKQAEIENRLNDDLMQDPRMVEMMAAQKERVRLERVLLEKVCTDKNIGDKVTVIGTTHAAEVSPAPTKRFISDQDQVVEILDEIKDGLAIELAGFKLSDLDKYMNPDQQEKCIASERKGSRKLKVESI